MSFWLHESKGISQLRTYSSVKRIIYSVCCLALLAGTCIYLMYIPALNTHNDLINRYQQITHKKNILEQHLSTITLVKKQKQSCDLLYQKALLLYGTTYSGADLLANILHAHRLTCIHMEPIGEKISKGILKNYLHITAHGSYVDVLSFLQTLEQSTLLIQFNSLSCKRLKKHKITCEMSIRFAQLTKGGDYEDSYIPSPFSVHDKKR